MPTRRTAVLLSTAAVIALVALALGGAALIPRGQAAPPDRAAPAANRQTQTQALARLGAGYVEQARITADPSYYPKAEQALTKALSIKPGDHLALTGLAALANGRHEFAQAARYAEQAIAANDFHAPAFGALADARTQLGDYPAASRAIDRMIELEPGVASFTRASYDHELRGDQAGARHYLQYALTAAFSPADVAFCRYHLGELALRSGSAADASRHYDAALTALPGHVPSLAGRARVAATEGRTAAAIESYRTVVERLPLPQYLVEYGEVLLVAGRDPAPAWSLLAAQRRLMAAAGVRDDLTWAEYEADHGDSAAAVRHARAEFDRNPNVVAADALAWALYRNARTADALPYTEMTGRGALAVYHAAVIRGDRDAVGKARTVNPGFDPRLPALARPS